MKICNHCNGTGHGLHNSQCEKCAGSGEGTVMVFWGYDQFPFILASGGTLEDDGRAFVPAYNMRIRPMKIMPLKEGKAVKERLKELEDEQNKTLKSMRKCFNARLKLLFPWAIKI
jgi:hypothetical protein